jgi:hypothetical protein
MLVVCSICNDGAEHAYCMPSMSDKVSESDWLCESCKLQQNASTQTVETPPNLRIVLKPTFLTSRKHNYGRVTCIDSRSICSSITCIIPGFEGPISSHDGRSAKMRREEFIINEASIAESTGLPRTGEC